MGAPMNNACGEFSTYFLIELLPPIWAAGTLAAVAIFVLSKDKGE